MYLGFIPRRRQPFPISANNDQTSLSTRAVFRYRQTGAFFVIKRGLKLWVKMEKLRVYYHQLPSGVELGGPEKGELHDHSSHRARDKKNRFLEHIHETLGMMALVASFLLTICFVNQ